MSKATSKPIKGSSDLKMTRRQLAGAVGDFIRYWGFRRIHGQIWTEVFLSSEPLSGAELTRRLRVSKALVSPALRELEEHELIKPVGGDGKVKLYAATEDLFAVIKNILVKRERLLLQRSLEAVEELRALQSAQAAPEVDDNRLIFLDEMIRSANSILDVIIGSWSEDRYLILAQQIQQAQQMQQSTDDERVAKGER